MQPKAAGFENGNWIEVADAASWTSVFLRFNWRFVMFTSDQFGIFEYDPEPAVLVDVTYRQVASFQRWGNARSRSATTVNVNGLFDSATQKQLVDMPLGTDLWPLTFCQGSPEVNATSTRAVVSDAPSVPSSVLGDDGALTLAIVVPTGVLVAFLAGVLSLAIFSGGPRLPLVSKSRGHADPNWIPPEVEQYMLPEVDQDRVDSWDDFDLRDPDIWTYYPSEFDTTDLEEEVLRMQEDPNYKKTKKRAAGRPGTALRSPAPVMATAATTGATGVASSEGDEEAVVDAARVFPPKPKASDSDSPPKVSARPKVAVAAAAAPSSEYEDEEEEYSDYSTSSQRQPSRAPANNAGRQVAAAVPPSSEWEEEEEYSYYSSSSQAQGRPAAAAPATVTAAVPPRVAASASAPDDDDEEEYSEEFEDSYEISSVTE